MSKLTTDEKKEICKILDNIYEIEKTCDSHLFEEINGTWETAVENDDYERLTSEALYDIMMEIEKIVDIVK